MGARDKVSHAFRTKKATWKRQHQHLLQQGGASNDNDNDSSHLHSHSTPFPSRKRRSIAQISIKVQRSRQQQQHKNPESVVPNLIKSQQKIFASLNMIPPSQFPHHHQHHHQQRRSSLDFSMHDRTYGSR